MKKKIYIKPSIEAMQMEMQQIMVTVSGVENTSDFCTTIGGDGEDDQTTDEVW